MVTPNIPYRSTNSPTIYLPPNGLRLSSDGGEADGVRRSAVFGEDLVDEASVALILDPLRA